MGGPMPTLDMEAYSQYLKQRSISGLLYRKYYLYPKLARKLTGRVLDYGCGIGDFVQFRANTVGVDINGHNVDYCRHRGLDAGLIEDNHIPFADGSFDGVMLDNVLEHIPGEAVDSVIEEIKRVLKTGGTLVVGVPGIKGYESDPDHKVFYSEESLVDLFLRHGFESGEVFLMPVASKKFEHVLRQFCVYAVFTLKNARKPA